MMSDFGPSVFRISLEYSCADEIAVNALVDRRQGSTMVAKGDNEVSIMPFAAATSVSTY